MQLLEPLFVLGNQTTRATLTAAYSGNVGSAFPIRSISQIQLQGEYTAGAAETANSIEIKVEFADPLTERASPATADWYQPTTETTVAGVTTLAPQTYTFVQVSAAGTYDRFEISLPVNAKFFRVSVKESGVVTNFGSASIKAVLREDITF